MGQKVNPIGLRVGISFMFGLSYSKKIPIRGFSGTNLLGSSILIKDFYYIFIFFLLFSNFIDIFFLGVK